MGEFSMNWMSELCFKVMIVNIFELVDESLDVVVVFIMDIEFFVKE